MANLLLVLIVPFLLGYEACRAREEPGANGSETAVSKSEAGKFTVVRCDDNEKMSIGFNIDCSHLTDPQSSEKCKTFILNTACKVYPAYRKITGVALEEKCDSVSYTIYTRENYPYKSGGGMASGPCTIDYLDQVSVNLVKSEFFQTEIGPYDPHELLHLFHYHAGFLFGDSHSSFALPLAEGARLMGERLEHERRVEEIVAIAEGNKDLLSKNEGEERSCLKAQTVIEASLYLGDNSSVYKIYDALRALSRGRLRHEILSEALYIASGRDGSVKQYLTDNGCKLFEPSGG